MYGVERAYSYIYKNLLKAVNPIKKKIIKTECEVHKFINNQSLIVLKNDGYLNAHRLMQTYIEDINSGVVWADQDLKSSNHFYNPITNRGMYGNSNAKKECIAYYTKALDEYFYGDKKNAMFYLGAACHLLQDLTVPQHASVKLLSEHRSYENWVISMHTHYKEFYLESGGIYLNSLKTFIDVVSKKTLITYSKYKDEKDTQIKYYKITKVSLLMAQRGTAGLMYKFYYDILKLTPIVNAKKRKTRSYSY